MKKKKNSFRTELSYNKTLSRNFVGNRNEKDKNKNEKASISRQYWILAKYLCMNFGKITLNQYEDRAKL